MFLNFLSLQKVMTMEIISYNKPLVNKTESLNYLIMKFVKEHYSNPKNVKAYLEKSQKNATSSTSTKTETDSNAVCITK